MKNTMRKIFKGTEKMWNCFNKQWLKTDTPKIFAGVPARAKKSHSAQITSNVLKLLSGGIILSATDMYGDGLRLKVRYF